MTSSEWEEFSQIAALCRGGNYNSINVASKIRSVAIVAAYEFIRSEFEKRAQEFKEKAKAELLNETPVSGACLIRPPPAMNGLK